jgi:hypothetical protein
MYRALLLATVTGMSLVAHPAPAHACHQDDDDADARDERDDGDERDERDDERDQADEVRASAEALAHAIEAKIDATLEVKLSRLERLLDDLEHRRAHRGGQLRFPPPPPPQQPALPRSSAAADSDFDFDFDLDLDVDND